VGARTLRESLASPPRLCSARRLDFRPSSITVTKSRARPLPQSNRQSVEVASPKKLAPVNLGTTWEQNGPNTP